MRSLSVHPNHYKKMFYFFLRKEKMPSLSTEERKAKFNTNDLIFTKKFNLPFGILLCAERSSTEYKFAELLESLKNKYKLFGTKSKQTVSFLNIPKKRFSFNTLKEIYNDRKI